MEANELMIGDYIYNLYGDKAIVRKLEDYNEHAKASGACIELVEGPEEGKTFCLYGQIEPIPLTQEILEKNEYKIGKPFSSEIKYPCFVGIYPELKFQIAFWERDGDGYWIELAKFANLEDHKLDSVIKKHYHYVHELQHALRLAGITKEIVL